jgi:hypothetical protein
MFLHRHKFHVQLLQGLDVLGEIHVLRDALQQRVGKVAREDDVRARVVSLAPRVEVIPDRVHALCSGGDKVDGLKHRQRLALHVQILDVRHPGIGDIAHLAAGVDDARREAVHHEHLVLGGGGGVERGLIQHLAQDLRLAHALEAAAALHAGAPTRGAQQPDEIARDCIATTRITCVLCV